MEDLNAPTQAQRIEAVLVDYEEAQEYAQFIAELWDKNLKYWETLKEEGLAMHEIAIKETQETMEAMDKGAKRLFKAEVGQ